MIASVFLKGDKRRRARKPVESACGLLVALHGGLDAQEHEAEGQAHEGDGEAADGHGGDLGADGGDLGEGEGGGGGLLHERARVRVMELGSEGRWRRWGRGEGIVKRGFSRYFYIFLMEKGGIQRRGKTRVW